MKRPHEDSGGESNVEMTERSCIVTGSLAGQDARTPREIEEDLRFREELADLKTRQLKVKVVNSMEGLSLQCINNNTDYFLDKQELINRLPQPVFLLLADFLQKSPEKFSKVYQLIISEKTQNLQIWVDNDGDNYWRSDVFVNVLRLIKERCKHTLTSLVFHLTTSLPGGAFAITLPRDVEIQINVVLSGLKNLTELSGKIFTDDSLRVLGENCEHLRTLRLDLCKGITDKGINYLCASAAPYGQCKSIETLSLESTSVSENGLVTALTSLPNLNILDHCRKLIPALEKFVKINGKSKQLQLKEIKSFRHFTRTAAQKVYQIIPHVTSVRVGDLENLDPLLKLDAVREFCALSLVTSLPKFNSFINKSSSSLTTVVIYRCGTGIDITVFGNCPNLEEIELKNCEIASVNEFPLLPDSFMKLKKLYMQVLHNRCTKNVLDVSYVMQLISSPTLSEIGLFGLTLPEANLYSLIVKAKEYQQIFSNLTEFKIIDNRYSLEILMQFICVCPKLKKIDVASCLKYGDSYLQLKRFAIRNNLTDLEFSAFGF